MQSDNGHLVFATGNNKEIHFQTSEAGRIKVNSKDLTQLLDQARSLISCTNMLLEFIAIRV